MKKTPDWLDYFAGGVPTPEFFRMTLADLDAIAGAAPKTEGINRQLELCYVGIHCYFEAFVKDHFGSVLNIFPQLLLQLREHGVDTAVDGVRVHLLADRIETCIGFLLAEKLDFGSPRKINANFMALLGITPIGRREIDLLEESLSFRNQIVHHGGTITSRFAEQVLKDSRVMEAVYLDSITLTHGMYCELSGVVSATARKLALSSLKAAKEFAQKNAITLTPARAKAFEVDPVG
jgi:hypothetical protein